MDSAIKKECGQAVIELTLALMLICVVVILATKNSVLIKNKFKHDFIDPSPKDPDFRIQVGNELIFFKNTPSKNLKALEAAGWKFDRALGTDNQKQNVIMTKDQRSILVTDKIGIIL